MAAAFPGQVPAAVVVNGADGKTVPAGAVPLLSQIHPSNVYVIGGAGLLSDAYVASVVADLGAPGP